MNATGFVGRAIERLTNSKTHHVVIAISETHVISAEHPRAVVRPMTDYCEIVWSNFELTDEQRDDIAFVGEHLAGTPYNYFSYPAIAFQKMTGIRIPDSLARCTSWAERMHCGQLCTFVYQYAAGIKLFDEHVGMVAPSDFEDLFESRGWLPELRQGLGAAR